MAIIIKTQEDLQQPLTPEQIAKIKSLKDREIIYDDDCPMLSDRLLEKARNYRKEHPIKNAG